jgi:hypothetical protein
MTRTISAAAILLAGAVIIVAAQGRPPEPAMTEAANALLATFDGQQRQKIQWPFGSEERFNWHFVPRERRGVSLKEMNDRQREAAVALLKAGLSEKGYTKVETIRSLENVLRAIEGRDIRDPELYFFTIFGDPGSSTWGWRYEGHHISQNWTIVNGKAIATTPAFFGANPAEVRDGPMKGTRALPAEETLAFALLASLGDAERAQAVVSDKAPTDILTGNSRKAMLLDDVGLAGGAMTSKQQALLMSLIEEHASSQQPPLAAARLSNVRAAGIANVRFAWMGATTKAPGAGHYYRVQGSTFLIEYDNTQNDANHQHVVWRDFVGDFGLPGAGAPGFGNDVLLEHYANDPHHSEVRSGAQR